MRLLFFNIFIIIRFKNGVLTDKCADSNDESADSKDRFAKTKETSMRTRKMSL
jgi:hypothetical protein